MRPNRTSPPVGPAGWPAASAGPRQAYHSGRSAAASALLREELAAAGGFPHALVTMWAWVTEDRAEADRVITRHLAPPLKRDPATLCGRVCVGPAGMCAELLSGFAEAGCGRVHFWPLGAEGRQVDLIASTVPGLRP